MQSTSLHASSGYVQPGGWSHTPAADKASSEVELSPSRIAMWDFPSVSQQVSLRECSYVSLCDFPRRTAKTRGPQARGARTLGSEETKHGHWEKTRHRSRGRMRIYCCCVWLTSRKQIHCFHRTKSSIWVLLPHIPTMTHGYVSQEFSGMSFFGQPFCFHYSSSFIDCINDIKAFYIWMPLILTWTSNLHREKKNLRNKKMSVSN